jgi:GxxExxY protein
MGLLYEELTSHIHRSAFRVHGNLGPGLLENTYETCFAWDMTNDGLVVRRQVELPVMYRGQKMECGYRIDLLVEDKVIIEVKAVETLLPIHESQLLTYMKLGGYKVGLLINFNVQHLKDGIIRRVL